MFQKSSTKNYTQALFVVCVCNVQCVLSYSKERGEMEWEEQLTFKVSRSKVRIMFKKKKKKKAAVCAATLGP